MTEQENDKHKAPAGDEAEKTDWPWRTKTQEYRLLAYTERVCDLPRRGGKDGER